MPELADRLKDGLAELRADGPAPGRAWCAAWTEVVDGALRDAVDEAAPQGRLALVATGGYGRREMCPASDVDLLLLHDKVPHAELERLVREVVYPLWDASLKVGHAVRDRRQAISLALDDLDTGTALLDARTVAGDSQLLRDAQSEYLKKMRRRPGRFLEQLTRADQERRQKAGDSAEVLEPDLKSGAGGLRDIQSLRWAAAALLGEPRLDALVSGRYLGAPDRARLARAYDEVLAARCALHLELDHPSDVLRMDHQQPVALALGYEDGGDHDSAAHRHLRDLYLAARTIDHVHRRAWRLIEADAARGRRFRRTAEARLNGLGLVDGVLTIEDDGLLDDDELPLYVLSKLVEHRAVLDRSSAAKIARAVDRRDGTWPWTPNARRRFLAALWAGHTSRAALAELDDVGAWVALLPEWEPVRGRPQRNPFHLFSLDRHAIHAAATLGDLVRTETWATEALEMVEDRDALMLGTLLHDVGKAYGEPHAETGAAPARSMMTRMGLGVATQELVVSLIRLHLLLPDVATRRDLADPDVIVDVARQVGDRQTLHALHLLTAADGLATGPSAWSSWKASLLRELVRKVDAVLEQTHPTDLNDGAEATAREALAMSESLGVDESEVRNHLAALPRRYAAAMTPRAVVRHAGLCAKPLGVAEVRTRVTPGDDVVEDLAGYDDLDVVAIDSAGLFSRIAGVIALHGGSILSADAHTRDDGIAVDTFTVQRPPEAGATWWAAVEGDIVEAVAGRLALRARLAKRAERYERRRTHMVDVPTSVSIADDESSHATILEIRTRDRTGVLFDITAALAELHLDIVVAKIATLGEEVVDVFYVRDVDGERLDPDHAREAVLAIESALGD